MNELNKLTDREFIEFFIRAFNAREDIGLTIGVVTHKDGQVTFMVEDSAVLKNFTGPELLRHCARLIEQHEKRYGKLPMERIQRAT